MWVYINAYVHTYHDALGEIGLGKDNGAHGFEHRD